MLSRGSGVHYDSRSCKKWLLSACRRRKQRRGGGAGCTCADSQPKRRASWCEAGHKRPTNGIFHQRETHAARAEDDLRVKRPQHTNNNGKVFQRGARRSRADKKKNKDVSDAIFLCCVRSARQTTAYHTPVASGACRRRDTEVYSRCGIPSDSSDTRQTRSEILKRGGGGQAGLRRSLQFQPFAS